MIDFKSAPFSVRQKQSDSLRMKFPNRVPCIVSPLPDSEFNKKFTKEPFKKFMVHEDFALAQFYCIIRKRLDIRADQAIFFYCKNTIPSAQTKLKDLYENFRDDDDFLYIQFSEENAYG